MEKIRLEILGLSSSQSQIGSFALVLGEHDGNRRLPIIIGGFEAQAIALEIENIKPHRPMTHDLILSIAQTFGIGLKEVLISDLKEGVFYSKLLMHLDGGAIMEVDSRPSDAIAIAVRYQAPIYTYDFILEEAGIVIKDIQGPDPDDEATVANPLEMPGRSSSSDAPDEADTTRGGGSGRSQQVRRLTQQMEEAIANEDYERAARLRDEIQKLEN